MKLATANLDGADIVAIAAYVSSRVPPPAAGETRTAARLP
jgi:hypothetical protein